MTNAVVATRNGNGHGGEMMETVLIKGDLSKLTPHERADFYMATCRSLGLNPTTRPLEYITLNGKLTLYARRDAADQLRKIHGISIEIVSQLLDGELFTVHVRAKDKTGRSDEDLGVVALSKLQGEARANATLKAITKAKRRVTLSICGLGFLDETEVEDIPAVAKRQNPHVTRTGDIVDVPEGPTIPDGNASIKVLPKMATRAEMERAQKEMYAITDEGELAAWADANANRFQILHPDYKETLRGLFAAHRESLRARKPSGVTEPKEDEDPTAMADRILSQVIDPSMLEPAYDYQIEPLMGDLSDDKREEIMAVYRKHEARLAP